jgi:UDP-glucose 4-epimerase
MHVLVTGGLGVNGVWVLRRLVAQGLQPVVFENRADYSLLAQDLRDRIRLVHGDVTHCDDLRAALRTHRIQRVVHMAAVIDGQLDPALAFAVNAGGTVNVLEAAVREGIERVVYTSSRAVYGHVDGASAHPTYAPITEAHCQQPRRVYDVTKCAGEGMGNNFADRYGLQFVALRFAQIYGPGKGTRHGSLGLFSRLVEGPLAGEPVTIPTGGDQRDDLIYVDDAAEAIVRATLQPQLAYRAYNVSRNIGTTLHDFADAVRAALPDARIEIGPGTDYHGLGVHYYGLMDNRRAREDLGFTPQYDLKRGVSDYLHTLRERDGQPRHSPHG